MRWTQWKVRWTCGWAVLKARKSAAWWWLRHWSPLTLCLLFYFPPTACLAYVNHPPCTSHKRCIYQHQYEHSRKYKEVCWRGNVAAEGTCGWVWSVWLHSVASVYQYDRCCGCLCHDMVKWGARSPYCLHTEDVKRPVYQWHPVKCSWGSVNRLRLFWGELGITHHMFSMLFFFFTNLLPNIYKCICTCHFFIRLHFMWIVTSPPLHVIPNSFSPSSLPERSSCILPLCDIYPITICLCIIFLQI